jgi:glyoxylase-like metal-dependent hydrolase (beta-lactamase superfamily II)
MDMKGSFYHIYALKYAGPIEKCGAHLRWQKDWNKKAEGNYYIWCIRNADRTLIVDTGASPEMAAQFNLNGYIKPSIVMDMLSIKPAEIKHVILSHLHWDHAGGVSLFPEAKYYVHEQEYLFWAMNRLSGSPPFKHLIDGKSIKYIRKANRENRVVLVKRDRQIFPGIKLIYAPGHSPGLMAVAVNTEKGTAVIGSDSAFIKENYTEEWPHDLIFNMPDYIQSLRRLRRIASSTDLLFPGHDKNLADDYPEIAPGITELM